MQRPRTPAATTIVTRADRVVAVRIAALDVEVVEGPAGGQRARVATRVFTIGSDPSNDLVLDDPTVSRFHLRLCADEQGCRVIDQGSANGTVLDGVRVVEAYLGARSRVAVGDTVLVISATGEAEEIALADEDYFGAAIGRSVPMRELFTRARRAAASDATVLIFGETGTGKDVLARAVHDHSRRAGRPMVVFDCGAVAPSLAESALFGHVRGAFTGADVDRPGVFEQAHGGTLFLDEIGELPVALQPKLLRALDSGTVTRVGSHQPIPFDVRFIAATNRDLREEVAAERFRSDLFFRLAVIPLEVPPLRDRPEDIPLLAAHFARHILLSDGDDGAWLYAQMGEAFGALMRHRWPGNVRELRNVIERAVALADPRELGRDGFSRLLALRASIGQTLGSRPPLKQARESFDREYLRDVLAEAQGDLGRAAARAGVHPKSLERLLRRYQVPRP